VKVLVGIDESEYSSAAISYIIQAAWPKTTRFLVLSAAPPAFIGISEGIPPAAITGLLQQQEACHSEIADRAAARLRKKGLSAEARMIRGDPRIVLVDAARTEHADLVIVGSHGRTGIKKLLLGSVASHVVTHAPCSVLVIKQ
jgi:nucleotide-binding universal stress UspA family protein